MPKVTLGGEEIAVAQFSAFKALLFGELLGDAEPAFRKLTDETQQLRSEWMQRRKITMTRTEARRQFRPQPLVRSVEQPDGTYVHEPATLEDGTPIVGPDPLAHLTEADWAACDHKLVIPEAPSDNELFAAMVPKAFKIARTEVMRMLALALVTNRTLEDLDEQDAATGEPLTEYLDAEVKKIAHRASLEELVDAARILGVYVIEQVRGPFDSLVAAVQEAFQGQPDPEPTEGMEPGSFELAGETPTEPSTSSTHSADATAGSPTSSSTAPPSGESPG